MSKTAIGPARALLPRAQLIAQVIAELLPRNSKWAGYHRDEELVAEFRGAKYIHYHRRSYPQAVLVFHEPCFLGLEGIDWGERHIVQSDVVERRGGQIQLAEGVKLSVAAARSLTKTRSLLEQAKVGAELAVKAYAEVSGEVGASGGKVGGKAGVEVSAKISAEYQRQWGGSTSETETESAQLDYVGPKNIEYSAVRTLDREQRLMKGHVDFSHTVMVIDEQGAGVGRPPMIQLEWASVVEFVSVAQGIAPLTLPMSKEFTAAPIDETTAELIQAPSEDVVEWLVDYDNVRNLDIKALDVS